MDSGADVERADVAEPCADGKDALHVVFKARVEIRTHSADMQVGCSFAVFKPQIDVERRRKPAAPCIDEIC